MMQLKGPYLTLMVSEIENQSLAIILLIAFLSQSGHFLK